MGEHCVSLPALACTTLYCEGAAVSTSLDDTKIKSNAEGPRRVMTDGVTVEQHPLPDQIAADQYLLKKRAGRRRGLGVKCVKLTPGGIV